MSANHVAVIPLCEECQKVWLPGDSERWQAHWIDAGPDEKLVFYCGGCARREFGDRSGRPPDEVVRLADWPWISPADSSSRQWKADSSSRQWKEDTCRGV